ncbi:MAG: Mur ligase family protein [Mariprofundaceae bacterium]|nr:Mur ligase family protein [Mariprofundaceae bacterium]
MVEKSVEKNSIEAWLAGLGAPSADRDYKPGHARMQALLQDMPLRHPKLRIRIAGTNGKGSTAFMLGAALQANGLKVGLYTSPHIHHFNERIRINGHALADSRLLALMPAIISKAKAINASYFEVATALALSSFSTAEVDVEILEAGVGARLDATTAVPADMALLTPVALDHQAWLGETLGEIAAEKAYIFDACRWQISADQADIVRQKIDKIYPDVQYMSALFGKLLLRMNGEHQQQNAALALAAVEALQTGGWIINVHAAQQAIAQTIVPGRLQKVQHGRQCFWLDAAHNRHAIEVLLPGLQAMPPFDAVFVFTREDRDLRDVLPLLKSLNGRLISGMASDVADAVYSSLQQALENECSHENGTYLVLGSFLTLAAAENWLKE